MKYKCPKCGYVFEGEVRFCPNCGQSFSFSKKQEEIKDAPIGTLQNNEISTVEVVRPASTQCGNSVANQVFNFFWFLFIGLASIIWNIIYGVALCCTLIGIPAGIMCFKFIPVVAKPAGREVLLNFKSHPILNTLQFIFGGFISYILCLLISGLLFITVVGIPLGRQFYKISLFYLAPFGTRMVYINQYTDNRDTMYDLCYFLSQIYQEDKKVLLSNGKEVKASEAMKLVLSNEEKDSVKRKLGEINDTHVLFLQRMGTFKPDFRMLKSSFGRMFFSGYFFSMFGLLAIILTFYFLTISGIFKMDDMLKFWDPYGIYLILFLLALHLIFALFGASDVCNFKKPANVIFSTYLTKWKNITYYYPNKADSKYINGRKNRNLYKSDDTKLSKYQLARSLKVMLLLILDD